MMNIYTKSVLLALFFAALILAKANAAESDKVLIDSGNKVYMSICFACHGVDGKGLVPGTPNLIGKKSPLLQDSEILRERILNGYQSKGSPLAMPPKGGNPDLTLEDIDAAIAYMKSAFLKSK